MKTFWQFMHTFERNTLYHVPGYLSWWQAHRTGECTQCGLCCPKCEWLTEQDELHYCSVYFDRKAFKRGCYTEYPESWLQLKASGVKGCAYGWRL